MPLLHAVDAYYCECCYDGWIPLWNAVTEQLHGAFAQVLHLLRDA